MSFNTQNLAPDGFQVVNAGVNSGVAPNTLERNQAAFALNAMFRGGFPAARYGWIKRPLKFLNADGNVDTTLRDNFEDGLFQGACPFERFGKLVSQHSGRLFAIDVSNFNVVDVSISGDLNRSDLRQAWMIEAGPFVIVQDGQAAPIFFNGSTSRRSDTGGVGGTRELPTGTVMAYAMGRVWVANPFGTAFIAGDIVYGPTGTSTYNREDAIIKVTENDFLNEGGSFGIPLNAGTITAMAPIAQVGTSTGQGPLQVFTERAAFSINAPISRETWKSLEFPIQTISLIDSGASGPYAFALVNGDIWFRAEDGVRSFAVAFRDFGTWVNTPLSKNVERVLDNDSRELLTHSSAALYDNQLIVTAAPYWNYEQGIVHRGFVALDFNPLGVLGGRSPPLWNGAWTGFDCHHVLSGRFNRMQRCFAYGRSSDGDIELWELDRNARFDNDGADDKLTEWRIEGPALNWPDKGWNLKRLEFGDTWWDEIQSTVSFDVSYRPDSDPRWQAWHNWSVCANRETCLTEEQCSALDTLQKQYRSRMRFPTPGDDCDSLTGSPYRFGFEFQPRLKITGPCRLKKFRAFVSDVADEAFGECLTEETCTDLVECSDDVFDYRIDAATNA